jgi:DNA-binding MarR family transcriptional regulator
MGPTLRRRNRGADGITGPTGDGVEGLLDEVRRLYHRAVQVAEELHADEPVTVGMRAVLEFLFRHGAASVPQIARRRFVTRQHIQALVNKLLERGLVALEPNPAHRRSALAAPTPAGRRVIERMLRREARFYAAAELDVRRETIEEATRTLARVRRSMGGAS